MAKNKVPDHKPAESGDGGDLAVKLRQAADKLETQAAQPRTRGHFGGHQGKFSGLFLKLLEMLLAEFLKDEDPHDHE